MANLAITYRILKFHHYFWCVSNFFRRGEDVWEIWQQKLNKYYEYLQLHCYKSDAMELIRIFEKSDELSIYKSKYNNSWDFKKQFL